MYPTTLRPLSSVAVPRANFKPWNTGFRPEISEATVLAGVGDVHGHFGKVRAVLSRWDHCNPWHPIRLAMQVGDLEAHRYGNDVNTMVAPLSHRVQGDFSRFHSGGRFPVPMLAISGNHESHGHLERAALERQGRLAENIDYGGRLFTRNLHGVVITGLSGIYGEDFYDNPRPTEFPTRPGEGAVNWRPWVYFTRAEIEQAKVMFLGANILVVHDWPAHLVDLIDPRTIRGRLNNKARIIGNEPVFELLSVVKPDIVLCGHHHQFLSGQIYWQGGEITEVICLDRFGSDWLAGLNFAAMVLSKEGVRVLFRNEPKVQTPELRQLRHFMTNQDKTFQFSLDVADVLTRNVRGTILLALTGCTGDRAAEGFTHGGFCFTLVQNDDYDAEFSRGDVSPHLYGTHYLRISPSGDPGTLPPERVLAMARKVQRALSDLEYHPTLLANFSDHVD